MKKKIFLILIFLGILMITLFFFFFIGKAPQQKEILWGVNFSQKHAEYLGLDWKEAYRAILNDLGATRVRLAVYWNVIEPKQGVFVFDDIDWQVQQAEQQKTKLILVVGMKEPRWPECHAPDWSLPLSKISTQEQILKMMEQVVLRYKNSPSLAMWQVENEPLISFSFGLCPAKDEAFLKQEIALVRSLDPSHPILVSDSGELSLWTRSASIADTVGVTMYRRVWSPQLNNYFTYPLPPVFYWRKAELIQWLFGKRVIGVELQAEPWGPGKLIYDTSVAEQMKTMSLSQLKKNIAYARKSGLSEQYFWGAEWWYWMKTKQNDPSFWNEVKTVFAPK